MNSTRQLAEFVCALAYDTLPEDVIESAKKCILDYYGCAIFATQTDMGKIITGYAKTGNFGNSMILPTFEGKYNAANAALANGTCAHGFELDDVSSISISHPGACVIPAVIALAEDRGIAGKRVIEAIVAGYEVMVRVGSTIAAPHIAKGFHPTASFGVFGATAGCGKLLGLTAEQMESAFGLAGSMASGLQQFSISGSMVKRIHAGKSAQQGVIVSQLAQNGFTGPADIFEAKYGFCRVFCGDATSADIPWERLTKDLGKHYAILDTTYKLSPACGVLHTTIECIEELKKEEAALAEKLEKVVVKGSNNLAHTHNVYEPDTILAAQYSLPFSVALACLGDLSDPTVYLSEEILTNKKVLELAKKVTTEFDPDQEKLYPAHFSTDVTVYLSGGRTLHKALQDAKGSAARPVTLEQFHEKYYNLVKNVLTPNAARQLLDRVYSIDSMQSAREIMEGLEETIMEEGELSC